MRRGMLVCGLMFVAASGTARAQDAASPALTPTQLQGRHLFGQDCGVCHTKPTITSPVYGPVLSKDLVNGNEAAIRDFISHGSERMPGFQYYYKPSQIEAVVEYLKTVPAPSPSKPPPAASSAPASQDN